MKTHTPKLEVETHTKSPIILKVRDADLRIDAAPNGETFINIDVRTKPLFFSQSFYDAYYPTMIEHGFTELEAEEFMDTLFKEIESAAKMKVLKSMLVL